MWSRISPIRAASGSMWAFVRPLVALLLSSCCHASLKTSANTDAPQPCVVFFDWIVSCAKSFTDGATCLWSSEVHNMSVLAVDSELSNKLKMWEERVFGDEVCCFG